MYPYKTTVLIGALLFGVIIKAFKKNAEQPFQSDPEMAKTLLPRSLFAIYLFYCFQTGMIDPLISWEVYAYLSIPCVLLWQARDASNNATPWDWLALLALRIPLDLRPFGHRKAYIEQPLDYHVIELSALIISLIWWVWVREFDNEKICFPCLKTWKKDLSITIYGAIFLFLTVIPIAIYIGFLFPKDFIQNSWPNIARVSIEVLRHTIHYKFLLGALGYGITVALVEEFWFRCVLQKLLERLFHNPKLAWVLGSVLFGLTHLNKDYPWNWKYALVATIAGAVYSKVYTKTSSIWYVILLHALTDATSQTFFNRIVAEVVK